MRNCNIKIGNDGQVTVTQITEYIEEHGATQLVITLNNELKNDSISYYTLCFKPGAALKNPPEAKITSDMIELSEGPFHIRRTSYCIRPAFSPIQDRYRHGIP